jgi:flavin-dependent dehydrogenase
VSPYDEFRVGRMALLYQRYLDECIRCGAEWLPAIRYVEHTTSTDASILRLEAGGRVLQVRTRYIVGADGAASRVAEHLSLDLNSEWIVGIEEVLSGIPLEGPPKLHCFVDPRIAPGYLAWLAHDGEQVHLGVGGYPSRFDPTDALKTFRLSLHDKFDFRRAQLLERRGGRIPVNGILRRIANERGLLIGDAAGAVSPLTAGGLDPCLRLSTFAAAVIEEYLESGDAEVLRAYSGEPFRTRFVSRLWMRRLIASVREPSLIELGCGVLRLPILNSLTWQVFFGRGSFPDLQLTHPRPSAAMVEASRAFLI